MNLFTTLLARKLAESKASHTATWGQINGTLANQTDLKNSIDSLQGQIDTFTALPPGSTAGDAELTNIRVDSTGHIYPTAGDAVRAIDAQVNAMKTGFDGVVYDSPVEMVQGCDTKLQGEIDASFEGNGKKIKVSKSATSGTAFTLNIYTDPLLNLSGKTVMFRYECNASIFPNGASVLTANGKWLSSETGVYYPNATYIVKVADDMVSSGTLPLRLYAGASNVQASGDVVAYFYPQYDTSANYSIKELNTKMVYETGDVLYDTKTASRNTDFSFKIYNNSFSNLKNKYVKIRYECDSNIFPNGVSALSGNGKALSIDQSVYMPNVTYIVKVSDDFADNGTTPLRLYSQSANVQGTGCVEVVANFDYDMPDTEDYKRTLYGKALWTLWDSLGHNTWQTRFTQNTGSIFDSSLNVLPSKPISWGGSNSSPENDSGTQARAINLASYKDTKDIDIIIIENINDIHLMSHTGNRTDQPFMRSKKVVIDTEATSYSAAVEYANSNLSSILSNTASADRVKGSILAFKYSSGSTICGSKITFTHAPTSNGNISISWDGHIYSIPVTTSMTTEDIASEFSKYSFGSGVTDVASGSSITITYYTTTSNRATFDGSTTGVTATVEDSAGIFEYCLYYYGYTAEDWTDASKWSSTITLYSIYKGLISYLQKEFPEALIFWCTPWAASVNFSSNTYKDPSGEWSEDLFALPYASLYDVQKDVCEMYNIPVLELDKQSGMSIINIETYFYSNNVHPKSKGYDKYADTMANMIGRFVW